MVSGMSWIQLALVVVFAGFVAGQINPHADCCDTYCFREDENPYLFFGTKTAYEFIYGKSSNQHIIPYCKPVQIWSFNRHGARYPSAETIKEFEKLQKLKENIIKNYDVRGSYPDTGKLCDRDLEVFRRWQWNQSITENQAHDLTQQGRDDLIFLARRYQTRYPELLRVPYSNQHYEFQYTNTDRTRSSYEAFVTGLFGPESYRSQAQPIMNDNITRAYKTCNAWLNNVKNNPDSQIQLNAFKERDEYKRVVAHVSKRLGFRWPLSEDLIRTIYDMCRYEKAWNVNRVSTWCAAFTKEHLKIMEYAEDLKYYYTAGYGHELNHKLGCTAVKDMMSRFERTINGDMSGPKVVMHFSHTEALQLLMVALGINKDSQPLSADAMRLQQRRLWRTSQISPFSANLVAALYECHDTEKHRVMFFLNEKPVEYPGCAVGLCSWNFLRRELEETINSCDLEFCDRASAYRTYLTYPLLAVTLLVTLLNRF